MLPADLMARYLRRAGEEVLFICATDEHGTPAEIAAHDAGMEVEEYCSQMHSLHASIYETFGLSFDHFGRSSSPQNHAMTQYIYGRLEENGFIEERDIKLFFSIEDNRFLPDRYIIGTCPKCGYEAARGDQCENCTSLLDPTDLIDPRSAISGSKKLEIRSSRHLFLRQTLLSQDLRRWIDEHAEWPVITRSIAYKWLDEGLRDRCITRDSSWGIPVPRPGFTDKVFYVWFDAPIEYIAATVEWAEMKPDDRNWQAWWRQPDDVKYIQFMAKDNVPFHTISWPATMIGTRETWVMANFIKSFNWLTYYGGKFSTSRRRGVFMDEALKLFAPDYWRYFLMAHAPESSDADFTWELFASTVNKDLADKFGNFINRTLKLTSTYYGLQVPEGGEPGPVEIKLRTALADLLTEYDRAFRNMEFRKVIITLRAMWDAGNVYFDECKPWDIVKKDSAAGAVILRTAINLIYFFAEAAWPIIPFTSGKIFDALKLSDEERTASTHEVLSLTALQAGRAFEIIPPLFMKIDKTRLQELNEAFSGIKGT
jgi:methionyl-tRNA synthetase